MQITVNKPPLMLGVKETAEHFGISQHYCRQLALSGAVKAVRIGKGKIMLNADSVMEFFNSVTIPEQMNETASQHGIQPIPVKL